MNKKAFAVFAAVAALATPAAAANCEGEFGTLAKAISAPTTMDPGHRAAMMRLALSGYDACLSGDSKNAGDIQAMLMKQLRENLGEH